MKSSTPASSAIGLGRQGIVARDHHHPKPHLPEPGEPFADALLQDIFELDQADDLVVGHDGQRRRALRGDRVDRLLVAVGDRPS